MTSRADGAEVETLLEAVYQRFHYDFRGYARSSLERRIAVAERRLGCSSLAELRLRILDDPSAFAELLQALSVQVSDLFRDPSFYRAFREMVVPVLRTYPSLKIWVAGCCGGEEVYSYAILLHEEGLLERSIIYGTDINGAVLRNAATGIYPLDRMRVFSENHRLAGGKGSLSAYYTAAYGAATFDRALTKGVVFADHDLVTDSVFGEVQVISCRNVLMYFDQPLRGRVLGLFADSLCRRGFLGLGSKETLSRSRGKVAFSAIAPPEQWYQREPEGRLIGEAS